MPANTQWIGRHSRIVRIEDPIRRQPAPWPRRPRGQLGLYRSQVARTNGLPGCTLLTLDDEASSSRASLPSQSCACPGNAPETWAQSNGGEPSCAFQSCVEAGDAPGDVGCYHQTARSGHSRGCGPRAREWAERHVPRDCRRLHLVTATVMPPAATSAAPTASQAGAPHPARDGGSDVGVDVGDGAARAVAVAVDVLVGWRVAVAVGLGVAVGVAVGVLVGVGVLVHFG